MLTVKRQWAARARGVSCGTLPRLGCTHRGVGCGVWCVEPGAWCVEPGALARGQRPGLWVVVRASWGMGHGTSAMCRGARGQLRREAWYVTGTITGKAIIVWGVGVGGRARGAQGCVWCVSRACHALPGAAKIGGPHAYPVAAFFSP